MGDKSEVYLYIPNLIGYVRVALTAYSFYVAETDWKTSIICYAFSFICDYFDGFFARWFNQCSTFGAVLDMVTDRCSTAGLLVILSHLYPAYKLAFLFLLVLDFSSHWYHMYASRGHHKSIESKKNVLLRVYYGCYPLFGYCCVGAEFFYILLYVLSFEPTLAVAGLPLASIAWYGCFPACVMKNIINVAQLASAAASVAEFDYEQKTKAK
ncbi:hypothetical protein SPRG_16809 [Saprolegnia parasitica CBS 223.65]|uniref:CDP-diacylglycerol--inositol 3-phosphatidyltransferase n=1 Tax=Saprolegnia parasitica (strain CBS 223.65) TaxID=695850 RepID=A0A067BHE0_SAPPC|nr:hypothetical protein SPRG_16809 [Saprolegnia parasitica CBS 223.65]KDO17789.1 hypothetical protein SPRG_16809 [Saprolegnia parasitica CBS 223.65]|eukprot:XP_012211505.1 hypothetical protein SPRG_16809 [Saprolegnia parasitica CBS 223.65]